MSSHSVWRELTRAGTVSAGGPPGHWLPKCCQKPNSGDAWGERARSPRLARRREKVGLWPAVTPRGTGNWLTSQESCRRGAVGGFPSARAPRGLVPHLGLAPLSLLPSHSFGHLANLSFRENLIHMVWDFVLLNFSFVLCTKLRCLRSPLKSLLS